jgi:hypothetical protein
MVIHTRRLWRFLTMRIISGERACGLIDAETGTTNIWF